MYLGRKSHLQFRGIGWLLVASLFVTTVQPMHVHLKHVDDSSSLVHEHVIDLHSAVDNITFAGHEDSAVFPVIPDVMLKKSADNPLLVAIIVYLTFLLLRVAYIRKKQPAIYLIKPKTGWFSIAPPLRGPPYL